MILSLFHRLHGRSVFFLSLPLLLLRVASAATAQTPPAAPLRPGTALQQPPTVAAALPDIRDIKGPVEIATFNMTLLWIGIILLLAAIFFFFLWRKQRRRQRAVLAHETALKRLQQAQEMIQTNQAAEFAELLSDILRTYIEQRFHLRARNRTTREFIEALTAESRIPPLLRDHRSSLQQWLDLCDMAKFACCPPGTEQMQSMYEAVRAFITATGVDEQKSCQPTEGTPASPDNERQTPLADTDGATVLLPGPASQPTTNRLQQTQTDSVAEKS